MAAGGEFDKLFGQAQPGVQSGQLGQLEDALGHVWEVAKDAGLDPFPTHFSVVPAHKMYEIGSYGLPSHYSHWTHGRTYRQLKTGYDYGLSKIYEVVVNANPSEAYLLDNNEPIENILVMAHVLGHTDFFKNNRLFGPTRKDMPQAAALSADRIRAFEQRYGKLPIEDFLDAALAISEHIDPDPRSFYRKSPKDQLEAWQQEERERQQREKRPKSQYDDLFSLSEKKVRKNEDPEAPITVPYHPDRDLLGFIRDYAPDMKDWQREVIDIVREHSFYFHPQMRTKIMNEGWASFWHKRLMREMADRGHISSADEERWWIMHSGVVVPSATRLNPYHFGMSMFDYLEDYHNGNLSTAEKRWLESQQMPVYPEYKGPIEDSPGRKRVREVMETGSDQSFIRDHYTKVPHDRMNLYLYERVSARGAEVAVVQTTDWRIVRDSLVGSMNNGGNPYIEVADGDYDGYQELYLRHKFEGQELDPSYLRRTLPYIAKLWGRPVHIETVVDDKRTVFMFDGEEVKTRSLD